MREICLEHVSARLGQQEQKVEASAGIGRSQQLDGAQAPLGMLGGHEPERPDGVVERVEHETALGQWGYEAVDTKLARNDALPSHALQLCFYSEGIEKLQGAAPRLAQ